MRVRGGVLPLVCLTLLLSGGCEDGARSRLEAGQDPRPDRGQPLDGGLVMVDADFPDEMSGDVDAALPTSMDQGAPAACQDDPYADRRWFSELESGEAESVPLLLRVGAREPAPITAHMDLAPPLSAQLVFSIDREGVAGNFDTLHLKIEDGSIIAGEELVGIEPVVLTRSTQQRYGNDAVSWQSGDDDNEDPNCFLGDRRCRLSVVLDRDGIAVAVRDLEGDGQNSPFLLVAPHDACDKGVAFYRSLAGRGVFGDLPQLQEVGDPKPVLVLQDRADDEAQLSVSSARGAARFDVDDQNHIAQHAFAVLRDGVPADELRHLVIERAGVCSSSYALPSEGEVFQLRLLRQPADAPEEVMAVLRLDSAVIVDGAYRVNMTLDISEFRTEATLAYQLLRDENGETRLERNADQTSCSQGEMDRPDEWRDCIAHGFLDRGQWNLVVTTDDATAATVLDLALDLRAGGQVAHWMSVKGTASRCTPFDQVEDAVHGYDRLACQRPRTELVPRVPCADLEGPFLVTMERTAFGG